MEIAHAMMAKDNPDYDRNESHLTAYAASYMLCKQYGINTDDFTFEVSPESETNEPQDIKKELTKIKSIANDISNRMEPTLVKNRATKEKSYEIINALITYDKVPMVLLSDANSVSLANKKKTKEKIMNLQDFINTLKDIDKRNKVISW